MESTILVNFRRSKEFRRIHTVILRMISLDFDIRLADVEEYYSAAPLISPINQPLIAICLQLQSTEVSRAPS